MGALRRSDSKVTFQQEGVAEFRRIESGDLTVEFGRVDAPVDFTRYFRGLPDDMCQCRHQGYVVRGRHTSKQRTGPSTSMPARPSTSLRGTSPCHSRAANG